MHLRPRQRAVRLALICRQGHQWKLERLRGMLPPHFEDDVLIDQTLSLDDLSRLARYDIVFFKSKDARFLDVMAALEATEQTLVINPVDGVRLARDRAQVARVAAAADVPVPRDFLGPLARVPFPRFVIKGALEDDPMTPIAITSPPARDALTARLGEDLPVYAQEHIDSPWEYKVYCADGALFSFRQRPTLINPNKHATRQPVPLAPALASHTRRVMEATGLRLVGVDFLHQHGRYFMTDVNSILGLQGFHEGCQALIHVLRSSPGRS